MKCVVCGAFSPLSQRVTPAEWDWFTGYFDRTAAFCPKHRECGMRHLLYEFAQRQPPAPGQHWSLDRAVRDLKLTIG